MDVFNSALKNPLPPQRKQDQVEKTPPMRSRSPPDDESRRKKNSRRKHRNSHLGCGTCKKRRIKCDENLPQCFNCVKGKLHCAYLNLDAPARNALRMAQFNQNLRQDRIEESAALAPEAPDPAREPAPDRSYAATEYYQRFVPYAVPLKGLAMQPMQQLPAIPHVPLQTPLQLHLQVPLQLGPQMAPQLPLQIPVTPSYPMVAIQSIPAPSYPLMPVRMVTAPPVVYADGVPAQPVILMHEGDRGVYEPYLQRLLLPIVPMAQQAPPRVSSITLPAPLLSPPPPPIPPPPPATTLSPVLPRTSNKEPAREQPLLHESSQQLLNRASSILKLLT